MAITTDGERAELTPASLKLPGIVLGVGLGGFADGILLHQLLQWHHMLSSTNQDRLGVRYYNPHTVSGLEMNTLWDGVFHTVCWLAVLVGLAILYSRVTQNRRRVWASRVLWGWMLVGWGLFNLVEGVLDHHILGIHHVHGGPYQLWWDLGFLALGALLVAGGWLLHRTGRPVDYTGRPVDYTGRPVDYSGPGLDPGARPADRSARSVERGDQSPAPGGAPAVRQTGPTQ